MRMTDAEKFEKAKAGLKFCPECGQALEQDPFNVIIVACPLHGDFLILWTDGMKPMVQWRSLEMTKLDQDIKAVLEIGHRYVKGEISFLEASQMITVAQGKDFPDEPNAEERRYARTILDDYMKKVPPADLGSLEE